MLPYGILTKGVPGPTIRIVVTDGVGAFSPALYTDGRTPVKGLIGAYITAESNTVRYAFAVNPTQGANQVGHVIVAGANIVLDGAAVIREFRFINDAQQSAGVLQITPFYEI